MRQRRVLSRRSSSFQQAGDDFEACKARINLGQVLIDSDSLGAARRHLVQSLSDASEGKFDKLIALAASHLAVLNYKKGDMESAESFALRSNAIARPNGYRSILFRNVFYLWRIAVDQRDSTAMSSNERTLRALSNRIHDESPELEAISPLDRRRRPMNTLKALLSRMLCLVVVCFLGGGVVAEVGVVTKQQGTDIVATGPYLMSIIEDPEPVGIWARYTIPKPAQEWC